MDGLHLTLRFIGPTLDERLPVLRTLLDDAAGATRPFGLSIGGVEILPGPAHPRILSLGLTEGTDELGTLAGMLDRGLVAAGWPGETRPFRGHLTLARADGVAAGAATAAALASEVEGFSASWTADRLVLFESLTGGGPARYEPLAEARFAR
jgi:2'-5' RNA ligase